MTLAEKVVVLKDVRKLDIKSTRRARGLTMQTLADRVGVNVQTLNDWENGRYVPRFDNYIAVLEALA